MSCIVGIIFAIAIGTVGAFVSNYVQKANKRNLSKISFKEAIDLTDLPIITLKQGNIKVNFLLDTGSTKSIILPSMLETLEHEDTGEVGTVYGMEGNSVDTKFTKIDFMYNYINYTELFQVVDMSNAFNSIKQSTGVNIHGILGNSFFEKYGYVIDFQEFIVYGKNN